MKRWPVVLMLAGAMMAGQATPAHAINKEWSAALGFLGGVLVANNHHYRQASYRSPRYCAQPTYVVQQPVVERVVYVESPCPPPPPRTVIIEKPAPRGYYEYREKQVWVPGEWVYESLGCNTYRKVWRPGCYQTVTEKVWVSGCDDYVQVVER